MMSLLDWWTASASAILIFLIIVLATMIFERWHKGSRAYRQPSTLGGRGLKPEQIFPRSKTIKVVDLTIQKFKGII